MCAANIVCGSPVDHQQQMHLLLIFATDFPSGGRAFIRITELFRSRKFGHALFEFAWKTRDRFTEPQALQAPSTERDIQSNIIRLSGGRRYERQDIREPLFRAPHIFDFEKRELRKAKVLVSADDDSLNLLQLQHGSLLQKLTELPSLC